jgi:hypothetical protein
MIIGINRPDVIPADPIVFLMVGSIGYAEVRSIKSYRSGRIKVIRMRKRRLVTRLIKTVRTITLGT